MKKTKERADDVDRHVGRRIRERRMVLGMTLDDVAPLVGVTYQQQMKRELGLNRISAGALHLTASALGVEVTYFFEGMGEARLPPSTPWQRSLMAACRKMGPAELELFERTVRDVAAVADGRG